jgi:beta-glucosidase
VDLYRREFTREGSKIGIALNIDWMVPLDDSPAARKAADIGISHWLGMYADPIYYGEFPSTCIERFGPTLSLTAEEWALVKGSTDFFGLNHYSTSYTTGELIPYESANGVERCFGLVRTTLEKDGVPIGPTGQNNHPIQVPWGFRQLVQHVHKRYIAPSGQRLYITENGFATKDEGERPLEQIIRDTERQAYYALYLRELAEAARDDGVNVGGYMAWSLLDNLEWTGGWAPRFGVTYVDRSTPEYKRIPKDSAFMLQRVFQHLVKKE